jgi:hypothetical protein
MGCPKVVAANEYAVAGLSLQLVQVGMGVAAAELSSSGRSAGLSSNVCSRGDHLAVL